MKRFLLFPVLILALTAAAQPEKGSKEVTLMATFVNYDMEVKYDGRTSSNDGQYGVIYTRFGYFLSDAISIEPELSITINDATAPVFVGALHASYSYLLEEKLGVFFSGGAGLGNSLPVGQTVLYRQTEDADVKTFIFGGGIKYFLTPDIAFRNELRYQIWNWKDEYEDYDYNYQSGTYMYISKTLEYSKKDLMFLMGFTVIL